MDWRQMFDKSRIYPLILILLMYIGYQCRYNSEKELKKQQEISLQEELKNQKGLIILQGETMGTYYDIRYYSNDSTNYQKEIDSIFKDFSQNLSTYIPTSEISQFNQKDTTFKISPYFYAVLTASKVIHQQTSGAFDPTIMPLVNEWGFGFHKRTENLPTQKKIDSLKQFVNFNYVLEKDSIISKSKKGVMLDFSAVAKGYGVDVIANFLRSKNIQSLKVEIGGEVVCFGQKPSGKSWIIAIEHPESIALGNNIQVKMKLNNKALASSGNYRNFYEKDGKRYSHTISPISGFPVQHELLSVSVFAKDCMTADAYATAFMVLGKEKAKEIIAQEKEIEAYFIYNEGNQIKTEYTKGVENYLVQDDKK